MAIAFIKEKRKQKYLLLVCGVSVLVMIIIIYGGFFRKEKIATPVEPLFIKKTIFINFDVLRNPTLKEFYPFEEISPFEGEKGRENPFLPY